MGLFLVNGTDVEVFYESALSLFEWRPYTQKGYKGIWGGSSYGRKLKNKPPTPHKSRSLVSL